MEICDDDSDDNTNDGSELCLICEEYGKNEVWYDALVVGFGYTLIATMQIHQKATFVIYVIDI
jgi:hypothetical protein